jgi:hypothetical protein
VPVDPSLAFPCNLWDCVQDPQRSNWPAFPHLSLAPWRNDNSVTGTERSTPTDVDGALKKLPTSIDATNENRPIIYMTAAAEATITFLSFKNESLIAETKPQATVAAIRGGVRGDVTESIFAGMWVGSMYQRIQEEVAGSVSGRQLEFIINQKTASPWNTLIGGQIEFGKHFNIIFEGGIGPRSSILTAAGFRF